MDCVYRPSLITALVASFAGMVPLSCGDESLLGQTAYVRVVLGGLTTRTDTVDIVVPPAVYDFVATGVADADSADITLTVFDRQAVEITGVQFSLTLAEADASPGDTGSGVNTGVEVVEGVQSVSIDFRWDGSTPTADVGVNMSFYDNPDILSWTTNPSPPVRPDSRVDVEVEATNNEGLQTELTVDSQFIDANDGSVISAVALALDTDGLFKGTVVAPGYRGDHSLRIVATDSVGGTTQHERAYTVQ